jgi:hypothetical protein
MKRRTALGLLAGLPVAAADKKDGKTKSRKLVTNSTEYYEAQFLALFLALLSKDMVAGTTKLDKFLKSNGVRDALDVYFKFTTDEAFAAAYNILVTQGKFSTVIAFQDDFRNLSIQMVASLSGTTPDGLYPKVCPTDTNMTALLGAL